MHTATLRALGGSIAVTLPRQLLKNLGLAAGSQVEISADGESLTITPKHKKYTLAELLANCGEGDFEIDREFMDAPPAGRELL